MRRLILLTLTLFSLLTLTFAGSGAPAGTAADPVNCTGYPQPRLFLENQSWWEPQPVDPADPDHPGAGKQGHIHVGTCFPLYQSLSGDTLHLDINLKLHNMTGYAVYLRVDAYGDYAYEVPRASWTGDPNKPWHCETVDCEKWVSADFPLSRLRYGGDHEWNVYLSVKGSGSSEQHYNLSRWHASVARSLPEPPSDSLVARTRPAGLVGTGGDSWHETPSGKYARVGLQRADIPWNETTGQLKPISGVWRPRISFEKQQNFVWIDPRLHANPPSKGLVVWENTGSNSGSYATQAPSIDTRKLTNGLHRLAFGTGNVTSSGTHTGVGVIPFLVQNATGANPPPPPPPPAGPPPHHPPSPPAAPPPAPPPPPAAPPPAPPPPPAGCKPEPRSPVAKSKAPSPMTFLLPDR